MNINDVLAIVRDALPHLTDDIDRLIVSELGQELERVEIFVDRDATQQFGYDPDVNVIEIKDDDASDEITNLWLTLAPGNAYVVLPNDEDTED